MTEIGRVLLLLLARVGEANFAGDAPGFVFKWADGEVGAGETFGKIFLNKLLEAAALFTLRDVDELMHEQFSIPPAICTNNNSVADARAA